MPTRYTLLTTIESTSGIQRPDNAVKSAALCGPASPGIAHMWHMPGHIYSKLKRYNDAAWQQEASARVDHAHMIRTRRCLIKSTTLPITTSGWSGI